MKNGFVKSAVLAASFATVFSLVQAPASAEVDSAPEQVSAVSEAESEQVAAASTRIVAYEDAPLRSQPYASSHASWVIPAGHHIYVDCWVRNKYGNRWYRTGSGRYTYSAHFPSYAYIYEC